MSSQQQFQAKCSYILDFCLRYERGDIISGDVLLLFKTSKLLDIDEHAQTSQYVFYIPQNKQSWMHWCSTSCRTITICATYSAHSVHLNTLCIPLRRILRKRLSNSLLGTDTYWKKNRLSPNKSPIRVNYLFIACRKICSINKWINLAHSSSLRLHRKRNYWQFK